MVYIPHLQNSSPDPCQLSILLAVKSRCLVVSLVLFQGLTIEVKALWGQFLLWKLLLWRNSNFGFIYLMEGLCPMFWAVTCAFSAQAQGGRSGLADPHSHCFPCSTRLEMGKWMEDLNVAIEMAKKSTEKSEMLLENSVCNRSNSKWCSLPPWKAAVVLSLLLSFSEFDDTNDIFL